MIQCDTSLKCRRVAAIWIGRGGYLQRGFQHDDGSSRVAAQRWDECGGFRGSRWIERQASTSRPQCSEMSMCWQGGKMHQQQET